MKEFKNQKINDDTNKNEDNECLNKDGKNEGNTTGKFAALKEFFMGNRLWFFLFVVLSLAIPDLVLKSKVLFVEFRVDGGTLMWLTMSHLVSIAFSVLWIGLFMFLCIYMLPKKAGRIVFAVIASLADILMIAEIIYFNIFGRFFMLSSIFLANEGMAYLPILYQYLSPWLIIYTVLAIASLVFACMCWQKQTMKKQFWPLILVFPVGIVLLSSSMQVSSEEKKNTEVWSTWMAPRHVYTDMADPDRCIRVMGVYQFMARSVTYPLFYDTGFGNEDYTTVDDYIEKREKAKPIEVAENEMTGYFEDKNVIVIMMESLDDWMISPETTPTIYRLMNEGINFKQHIATPFGGGYTFNSEFAFNTGYYTPKSSSSASIYGYNEFPYTLPKLFKQKGYAANQFHYNKMEFYNRATMHKAFGYDNYISFMDYMSTEDAELDSNAMLLDDNQIYEKMTENDKFFDFVITYSAHLPYTSDDKIANAAKKYPSLADKVSVEEFKAKLLEVDSRCDEIDYSAYSDDDWEHFTKEYNNGRLLAKDTDEFIRLLVEKLEADGLLEDTVIVAFADHYTYGYSDENIVKGLSVADGEKFVEETPFFIYHKGSEPREVNKISATKDILPTLQNLFGLERFCGYIGDDIFGLGDENGFVYFNDMSWYDGEIYCNNEYRKEIDEIDEANMTDEERSALSARREYVEAMDKKMIESLEINDIVIAGDYFANRK